MPKRFLSADEALLLFNELPSDNDSQVSSEDSADEEALPQSDLGESEDVLPPIPSDSDEEVDAPGPSNIPEVKWVRKGKARTEVPDFIEYSGPSEEILELDDHSPLALFLALFSMSIMESIVFQTNLYSTQKGKNFSPLTQNELYRFLAINLAMGLKKMPSYRDYWSSCEVLHDSYISKAMSVKRFAWILSHLHLNDNTVQPKRGDALFDKLYKLRPLLSHLSERFLSAFRPSKCQSIDESMVKFKGRSSLKQYMPKKPIKRGYKIWMRCDQSGFVCQFEIYTGKVDQLVEKNLGARVVTNLSEQLYGKNHKVYMDNYFSSYDLFKFLDSKNVFACGTVNMSRKHMPKNLSADKTMKRGEYDWAVSNDNIVCVKWKDRRCVHILSTMENAINECKIERKEKDGSKKEVSCPQSVVTYNKNMGFVDHFDHLKSLYEIDRKSQKWWHRLFFHFLDVCVTNAYILHTQLPDSCKSTEVKTLKDFRINIISHLMLMGEEGAGLKRRSTTLPLVAIKKNKPSVPEETRFQNVQHMPIKCPPRRCALCSTKKMCTKHEQCAKHVMCHYV
ncbi:PiggyBac transposable element-derived protein 4 [Araneus ventricosus]|uniref:PiggyBac transposable element-derived protein 4 n=1 Tax=Araneus ventricosus TaxID=182803 RepID=A0A4Y2CBD7_ARAVE|nr:PiggyBac transposable element-derived protein 4 [Araneus ventricosus]